MKRVISFSIYGNNNKYTKGLLKNIELSPIVYPGWDIYVYYNNTVPEDIIETYKQHDNVSVFDMSDYNIPGVFWRFFPKDYIERFISRDTDSRLSFREKYAVDEWIESGKSLHVMRDHPHHEIPIHAGLFGVVIDKNLDIRKESLKWLTDIKVSDLYQKTADHPFLKKIIYDKYLEKKDMICHDSYFTHHPLSKPFPTMMEDYRFVGEIYDENDNREYQYREWINKEEIR
jgi:hypothetical protein